MNRSSTNANVTPRLIATAALIAAFAFLPGCLRRLFLEEQYRTPFEAYDRSLSQSTQQSVFDEYGTRRPNVRERLLATQRTR